MIRVNGRDVGFDDPGESLAEFLRRNGDKSCKIGCGIGACGACTVLVTSSYPTGPKAPRSLNACLAPVASLAGCEVSTSHVLGNSKDGFHAVQERVGAFHASQCGYCTPGMVVACHAAKEKARAGGAGRSNGGENGGATPELQAVEHGLDGNLCRCTGYRPLLDVVKSFAPGVDIEDLGLHSPLDASPVDGHAAPAADGSSAATPSHDSKTPVEGGGKLWHFPESLSELSEILKQHASSAGGVQTIVAGNTGSGIYKELWPSASAVVCVQRVREMRGIERKQDALVVGAAVTIAELADFLSSDPSAAAGSTAGGANGKTTGQAQPPFAAMAATLRRVAGTHVRNAATIGGNLVLARSQGLESDVATLLAGWGASVHANSPGSKSATQAAESAKIESARILLESLAGSLNLMRAPEQDAEDAGSTLGVLDFVGAGDKLDPGAVVTHVTLPLPTEGDFYWCHKIAPTYSNTHSIMNAAFKLALEARPDSATPVVSSATLVFGYPGHTGRRVTQRASAAEKALAGTELSLDSLVAALQAVVTDLSPAPDMQQYCRGTAQGLLLQALAPLLRDAERDLPPAVARLLQIPAFGPPAPVKGSQKFEEVGHESAPVGLPIEKDRVKLQASGEAVYTGDIDMPLGGLHAAFVTSTQARASIAGIDPSAALKLPGVVSFVSAKDIPKHRNLISYSFIPQPDEPIFADERVEYYGQPLGVMVATTQAAAAAAAAAVQVQYADIQQPIVTIQQALEAGQVLPENMMTGGVSLVGDPEGAIAGAELSLRGVEFESPSNYHFYMEPQVAMCVPDEGGSMKVYNSTQIADVLQEAVARALGLRLHDVNAICRRVGGGFGGKLNRNVPVATACAVAADKLRRPVQLVLERRADMALIGGRQPMKVTYDVGFTREGLIQGLDIKVWLMSGAYFDCGWDALLIKEGTELCYAIPNMRANIKTCRGNLPPFTSMRAPGKPQLTLLMEQVLDSVAAACGLDPTLVRELNLAKLPEGPQEDGKEGSVQFTFTEPGGMAMTKIPASEYTLPQLWRRLKDSCDYDSRLKEVEAFNAENAWVKRGITITHSRFDAVIPSKPAAVAIYPDGSVLVYAAGSEVGQGLTTKAKQVAVLELSRVLPKGSGPLPLDLVRMGDNTTYVLPRGFLTGGSTTSEGACAGVRKACQELVGKLKPFAEKLGEKATWEAVVTAACNAGGMLDPSKVSLLAASSNDATEGAEMPPSYVLFGAACSEVEINMLTGERQILRSDLMIDCGRSINPAIDIGQAEGAFVQGLGFYFSEQVGYDHGTGKVVTASPWHYAIPTANSIPRAFNVEFLPGVRFDRGILSSKAIGEPPLLLAASAFFAVQGAVRAAQQELRHGLAAGESQRGGSPDLAASNASPKSVLHLGAAPGGDSGQKGTPGMVQVPSNLQNVKGAIGPFDLAAVLAQGAKKG